MNTISGTDMRTSVRTEEIRQPEDLYSTEIGLAEFMSVRVDRLNTQIDRQTRQLLEAACGLTAIEWRCLATLCIHGASTGSDISGICTEHPSQVSRGLRSLRDKGLIAWPAGSRKRGFGPADVSDEGRALYDRVKPIMQARNAWLLNGLEEEEWREAYRLIAKLRQRMAQAPDLATLTGGQEFKLLTATNQN